MKKILFIIFIIFIIFPTASAYWIRPMLWQDDGTNYNLTRSRNLDIRPNNLTVNKLNATIILGDISQATGANANGSIWNKTGTNVYPSNLGDRVGIGTATPTAKLDVNGSAIIRENLNATSIYSNNYYNASGDSAFITSIYSNSSSYWDDLNSPSDITCTDLDQSCFSFIDNCSDDSSCSLITYDSELTYIDNCSDDQSCDNVIYITDKLGNTTLEIEKVCWANVTKSEWITPAYVIDIDDEDIESDINTYVDIAGDTMTGNLTTNDVIIQSMTGNNGAYTVNHFFKDMTSAGRLTGGEIVDAGGVVVNVTSGEGLLRDLDDDHSQVRAYNWDQKDGIIVPTNTIVYIGVDLNGGNPIIVNNTDGVWDLDTDFPLGQVINQNDILYIMNNPWWVGDGLTNIIERFQAEGWLERDDNLGGLILGYTGTRNPTMTQGTLWSRLTEHEFTAFESPAETFNYYYQDGLGAGGYIANTDQNNWSVELWDDGSGVLDNLPNNKYAVIWVWANVATDDIALTYPQETYSNSANAETEEIPTFPAIWYKGGVIIGRIIIKEGVDIPIEVQSTFTTTFTAAQAADHGNLAGLSDNDHPQYVLFTNTSWITNNQNNFDPDGYVNQTMLDNTTIIRNHNTSWITNNQNNFDPSTIDYVNHTQLDNETIIRVQNTSWITLNQNYNTSDEMFAVVNNGTFAYCKNSSNITCTNGVLAYNGTGGGTTFDPSTIDYVNHTQLDNTTIIRSWNISWVDNLISIFTSTLGNWSLDKINYWNTTNLLNGTLTKKTDVDNWIDTNVTSANTSMKSYVDAQNEIYNASMKAYVDMINITVLDLYPVGAIYISYNLVNPGIVFGGTWVALGEGRVLVGYDDDAVAGDIGAAMAEEGGSLTHTLTADEMPAHIHYETAWKSLGGVVNHFSQTTRLTTLRNTVSTAGGDDPHTIVQPYITVAMWRRTA